MSAATVTPLVQVLHRAAASSSGITIYQEEKQSSCTRIPYHELVRIATLKARDVRALPNAQRGRVVLLHFGSFQENVEWLWAVVIAGLVPAVSTPLPVDPNRRRAHLIHTRDPLRHPIVLTSKTVSGEFEGVENINLEIVDYVDLTNASRGQEHVGKETYPLEAAVLMLTSGSSGNAKAVMLRHEHIVAAVEGKSKFFETTGADVFPNWIGFDHVASLTESHIHAMYSGAELIHVPASHLLAKPLRFAQCIDQHRVTISFAPRLFLARLLDSMNSQEGQQVSVDVSSLRHPISGGESNLVETAVAVTKVLQSHSFKGEVIRPGSGMTETCAGCIYSTSGPSYDVAQQNVFASLGTVLLAVHIMLKLVATFTGRP